MHSNDFNISASSLSLALSVQLNEEASSFGFMNFLAFALCLGVFMAVISATILNW